MLSDDTGRTFEPELSVLAVGAMAPGLAENESVKNA
jgi:hypothetical protein